MLMMAGSSCGVRPTARARRRTGFEHGPGQIHVDAKMATTNDGHFQEQITELPDASFELRLRRPEL
jgi:hypothetical protein